MRTSQLALAVACGLVMASGASGAAGCSRAEDETRGKRTPAAPPPVEVAIQSDLRIEVTVDGQPRPPLDAATLQARPPDFRDPDRRAWRLAGLLPELDRPGASIEARGKAGVTVRLERPAKPGGLEPVLFLTRRGELVATMLDPAQPFPDYHGQGGRLRRPGDTMPHVSPVLALAVVSAP
jgi:hypothetical protein